MRYDSRESRISRRCYSLVTRAHVFFVPYAISFCMSLRQGLKKITDNMNTLPPVPLQISNYVWVLGFSSDSSSKEIRIFFRVKDLAPFQKIGLNLDCPACWYRLSIKHLLATISMAGKSQHCELLWGMIRKGVRTKSNRMKLVPCLLMSRWYGASTPALVMLLKNSRIEFGMLQLCEVLCQCSVTNLTPSAASNQGCLRQRSPNKIEL